MLRLVIHRSTAVIVAIAGSLSIAVATMLTAGHLDLWRQETADILPMHEVVVVVHRATPQTVELLQLWYPELSEISFSTKESDIALVTLGDDSLSPIVIRKRDGPNTPGTHIGAFAIEGTTEAIALVQNAKETLRSVHAYRTLAKEHSPQSTWTYAKRSAVPLHDELGTTLLQNLILADASHIAIAHSASGSVSIGLYAASIDGQNIVPHQPSASGILLDVQTSVLHSWHGAGLSLLTETEKAVVEGLQRQLLKNVYGERLSFTQAIQATDNVSRLLLHDEDQMEGLVELQGMDPDSLESLADAIHESFKTTIPTGDVLSLTLDNRFQARTLRENPESIQDVRATDGQWNTRSTIDDTQNRAVISYSRDDVLLIGNTAELLQQSAADIDTATHERQKSFQTKLIAHGTFDTAKLSTILSPAFTFDMYALRPLIGERKSTLEFRISQKNNLLHIHIE